MKNSMIIFGLLLTGCYTSHEAPPAPDPHDSPCACTSCHVSGSDIRSFEEIPVDCREVTAWFWEGRVPGDAATAPDAGH